MDEFRELYQEIILDHNKRPRNFRRMDDATRAAEGYNPLCGDQITVFLKLEGDRLEDVSFFGESCAICKASASLMTIDVKGGAEAAAREEIARFLGMLRSPADVPVDFTEVGDLASLSGVREFPARLKCATLAWHTLEAALDGREETSTE